MVTAVVLLVVGATSIADRVSFQAHRGAVAEAPENTMAAFLHAWAIPGAVPEVDVTTTADGAFVCIHDDTLARTTDAPAAIAEVPIGKLTLEQVRACNAAVHWPDYPPQRVPLLQEVLAELARQPDRCLYLDIKNADLERLRPLIEEHGAESRIIFVHGDPRRCAEIKRAFPKSRTMTWLTGAPDRIKTRFETLAAANFAGISQLQFHLKTVGSETPVRFALDNAFLADALAKTRKAGVALQLRPFEFDNTTLRHLVGMGVRWFVTDEPKKFRDTLDDALK